MKFIIKKNILLESINNVNRAISIKNIIPILNGIKMELTNEGLTLTASNTDITIKSFIKAENIQKIESTGNIVVQSKYIGDIIRKLPDEIINIELIDGLKLKIKSNNSEFNLNCLNSIDYPVINIEYQDNPILLNGNLFKTIIKQTLFATGSLESRPLLTGINFKISNNILEVTATDSYRLAKKSINLTEKIETEINVTLPGNNISEFDKIIVDDSSIAMHVFSNKIVFLYKNIIFQTNLLNGTYPNTNNLIPDNFNIIFNTNYNNFYSAIDRASLLTQNKDKNIVKMEIIESELKVSSYASEIGRTEEKLTIKKSSNENLAISFSAKYMLDALKTMDGEEIVVLLNSEIKPIVIKSLKDESLIQLILPIKTY